MQGTNPDFMTDKNPAAFEALKEILQHARNPELLDDHPWTRSLIVQEALANDPRLEQAGPGQQLVSAIAGLFPLLKPANPPRDGLRLDPRWGEFGLLAALYFMPYNNGSSFPTSFMDAWGRIDPAILYFVYGKNADGLEEERVRKYQLVGPNLEYGAASTLSDWHRKGVQRLAEMLLNRERFLARTSSQASEILNREEGATSAGTERRIFPKLPRRTFWISLCLCLLLALGLGAFKAWKVYEQGRLVYGEVTRLRELRRAPPGIDTLEEAGPVLGDLQTELAEFERQVKPFLWLSPRLGWVPVYGGDLVAAPGLLDLAGHLVDGAVLSTQVAGPLLSEFNTQGSALGPSDLTELLVRAQSGLGEVKNEFDQALAARDNIQVERLSPRTRALVVDELDPLLAMAGESLSLATALPSALGATGTGPKTYLLLVENEDELRPTGGFITTVGNLVVHNGEIISLDFEGVDDKVQEDWSKPYPVAPWQLQEYMNSRVLILRDANWFSDYPTSVQWAEFLYAYTHSHSVDGVIAFDQQFLVMLLDQLGELEVEGAPYPLTTDNVIEYMRSAKQPPDGEPLPAGWDRKDFIGQIAGAILTEIYHGGNKDWRGLATTLTRALGERHLLLQFDDPDLTRLLAERDWDNSLRPGEGDFLMSVDTNIGFNKTSALMDVSLAYDVDLSDLSAPEAALVLSHKNNADPDVPCIQWGYKQSDGVDWYPIDRCYWNYLRVYKQGGVELLEASPHAIPGDWMLLGKGVPAQVDTLEEEIPGVQGYGTLLVVPGSQTMNTGFRFALPPSVIFHVAESDEYIYRLKVQKQPGTLANSLTVRVHLPENAQVVSVSPDALVQDKDLLLDTDLRRDIKLEVLFRQP